jgi:tetratricopeptide (TPR) repeat protein
MRALSRSSQSGRWDGSSRGTGRLPVLLVAIAGIIGCASGPVKWRQVTTPHFVLRTDLDGETALRSGGALEHTRAALVSAAWPGADLPETERAIVYVFADKLDFQAHFGQDLVSIVISGSPAVHFLSGAPERWEVRKNLTEETTSYIRYQIAFQLVAELYPAAPRWLLHGLSQFLDTIHDSEDGKSVVMGALNAPALRNYRSIRSISVAALLTWDNSKPYEWSPERRGLDGLSWLLVHWLFNTRAEAFARYQQDLSRGATADQAFAAAFPGFDPAAADREIFEYSKHGNFTEMAAPLVEAHRELTVRELDPADLHVMAAHVSRAQTTNRAEKESPTFKTEVQAALALDPTNADAIAEQTWLPEAERLPSVRAATLAHPRDERMWKLLGDLLRTAPDSASEREAAYRKAIELAPKDPWTLSSLAWLLVERRRWPESLAFALRAVKLAPSDPDVLHTYAAASFGSGACKEAVASEQRAVALLPASADRRPFGDSLAEYNARCTKPARGKR